MQHLTIILLILTMGTGELLAQRIADPPPFSRFNGSPYSFGRIKQVKVKDTLDGYGWEWRVDTTWNFNVNINFQDTTLFEPIATNFLFGYHWGAGDNALIERRIGFNMPMSNYGFGRYLLPGSTVANQMYDTSGGFKMSNHWGIIDGLPYNRKINVVIQYVPFLEDDKEGIFRWNTMIEWRPSAPLFYEDSLWRPIKGDRFGSIFGFNNKQGGNIITDSLQAGFMGYALHPDSVLGGSRLVLSKPAMHREFRRNYDELAYTSTIIYKPYPDTTGLSQGRRDTIRTIEYPNYVQKMKNDSIAYWNGRGFSGNHWLLSVNLRRLPHISINSTDNISDTAKVITVMLKYWYRVEIKLPNGIKDTVIRNDSIKFDSVFTYRNSTDTLRHERGTRFAKLTPTAGLGDSSAFVIRRNAIPIFNVPDDGLRDICLGAYFSTWNNQINDSVSKHKRAPNIWFSNGSKDLNQIDSIDLQVTYHGNAHMALTHATLATPFGSDILWGKRDSALATSFDQVLRTVRNWQVKNPNQTIRLHRVYTIDESPSQYWRLLRYVNALMAGFHSSAVSDDRYLHLVSQKSSWSEESIVPSFIQASPTAPNALLPNTLADRYFRFHAGWNAPNPNDPQFNRTATNYDCYSCFIDSTEQVGFPWLRPTLPSSALAHNWYAPMCQIESGARNVFLNYNKYYGSKPFITRHNLVTWHGFGAHKENDTIHEWYHPIWSGGHSRLTTAEELRSAIWFSLLLGAKGLNYADGLHSLNTGKQSGMDTTTLYPKLRAVTGDTSATIGYAQTGLLYELKDLYWFKKGNDTIGDMTIEADTLGHDFFVPTPNSVSWQYVRHQRNADLLGVPLNRIYTGMKSKRLEIRAIHDVIMRHESEIMKLELCAWEGKGFNWFRTCRDFDTTWYNRFIDMRWGKVKVRPLNSPDVESWTTNQTYFDVALHRRKDVSMDSVFYLMVLNRHTNPLVDVHPNQPLPDTARYKFFSTFEFDSLVKAGVRTKYEQLGSRQISIPFSYKHPDNQGRMLRVQELTAPGVKGIDTLICRECFLTTNYLPGEGKMFKVTIKPIAPSYTIADSGSLESNSQRKVVSVPLFTGMAYNQPTYDTTKMVHHMVYHIMDTIIIRRNPPDTNLILPRRKVVYQRSDTMDVCTPKDGITPLNINNQQIVWERPQIISSTITKEYTRQHQCLDEIQYLNPDCAFPSLTVRVDSATGTEKVYVVYGCRGSDPTAPLTLNKFTVVECEFASSADSVHPIEHNQIIARIDSSVGEVVKPVIGSATRGNYIAYSDNHVIQTLYQHPNRTMRCVASNYTRHDSISWYKSNYYSGACNEKGVATNPTINTFTHLQDSYHDDVLSDGCTIAWQEKNDQCNSMTEDPIWRGDHIYLARLDPITLNGMQLLRGANDADVLTHSSDSRVVRMSRNTTIADNFINHTSPSIAQITEPGHDSVYNAIRVGWTAQNFTIAPGTTFNGIFTVSMWFERNLTQTIFNTTLRTRSWCPCEFKNPNLTVSRQSEGTAGYAENKDNYTLNANFASNSIMQFTFNRLGYSMTTPDGERVFTGRNAQLSAQPMYTQNNYWTRMRRVVNIRTVDSVPEKWSIRSAHELLFKRDAEDDGYKIIPMQGYLTKNSFVYLYDNSTDPEVRPEDKWKKTMRIKEKNNEPSPMVETNWHKVSSEFIMPILLCGNGLETMNLHVENRRTKARATIISKFKSAPNPHEPLRILLRLQNGGGDEYRLVMGQVGVISQPVTDIFIGKSAEYSAKSASIEESTPIEVDLRETVELHDGNMLSVFPDPNSGQSMTVQVHPVLVRNSRGNFKVSLLNSIGQVIHSAVVPVTATIRLDELNLPNGVYHIRFEYTTSDYELRMATTSVVVVR
jgi:hypothetical protein